VKLKSLICYGIKDKLPGKTGDRTWCNVLDIVHL
jgi:hypothetical protein